MKRQHFYFLFAVGGLLVMAACKKDSTTPSGACYVPVASDATATATLAELQSGRTIYVNSCGQCHGLYSPDDYSASSWKTVLSNMVPKAGLSQADAVLVAKYVSRGK